MRKKTFSDGEWKLMNVLWEKGPQGLTELTEELHPLTGWSKATVNMMGIRLEESGALTTGFDGRRKVLSPVVTREDALAQEAHNTVERVRTDGVCMMVSNMVEGGMLSEEEIAELTAILTRRP